MDLNQHLFCLIFISIAIFKIDGSTNSKSFDTTDSIEVMTLVKNGFGVSKCFDQADQFMRKKRASSNEEFYAGMWINMYTKKCSIENGLQNYSPEFNNFPMRLNWELRCAHKNRNKLIQDLFIKAANNIDSALTYLPNKPARYYRGVKTFNYKLHQKVGFYYEAGFFSTTTRLQTANNFANGNILIIVEVLHGYAIKKYSDFPNQEEVLCRVKSLFRIYKVQENVDEIEKFMKNVKGKRPKVLVWMKQVSIDTNTHTGIINTQLNSQETMNLCDLKK